MEDVMLWIGAWCGLGILACAGELVLRPGLRKEHWDAFLTVGSFLLCVVIWPSIYVSRWRWARRNRRLRDAG
jgi:hypothetical protein